MRVRPTPILGVALAIGYIILWIGLAYVFGGDITDIDSGDAIRPFAMSLTICAVTLIVVTTILGWWTPVLWERPRLTGLAWIAPVLMIGVAIVSIATGGVTSMDSDRLLWTVVLAVLVGFSEEMAFRGLALVGMRGGASELNSFLVATILFSLLHAPNVLLGAEIIGVPIQLVLTFLGGTALYLARRAGGTILVAMVAHGLWDFSTFAGPADLMAPIQIGTLVVIFVLLIAIRRQVFEAKVEVAQAAS